MTQEEFLQKAKKVHGDKYDYSKVEYKGCNVKVCIICPKHGEFFITPGNFLFGQGCRLCGIEKRNEEKRLTLKEFIKRAIEKHGNKYDYSNVNYINCDTKVHIICPEHGEFLQRPYEHLIGHGCPVCANNIKYTTEIFVNKAKEVHGNKYDYSKVEYVNALTKVCIICPEHGEFWQKPVNHIYQKNGCPKCKGKNKTTEDFIEEVMKIHGKNYDYSNVIYNGASNPIRIICHKHGEFITTPHSLLSGHGCPKCSIENTHMKQTLSKEEFIKRAIEKHGNKYDYSKVEYINAKTPVYIICHKKDKNKNEHGGFYVTPNNHTSVKKTGCPKCSESNLEKEIRIFCEQNNINFVQEKKFTWLGPQRLDFFLPDYNIAIECQGIYHFEPHYFLKTKNLEENLLLQIRQDELKYKLINENGIKLLYYIPQNLLKKAKISKIYSEKTNVFTNVKELKKLLNLK